MTKYNTIRHLEVKALRAKGLRNNDIALALGMSASTASALYRYRPTGRKKGGGPDNGKRKMASELKSQGLTLAQIGQRMGVSKQAVQQLLAYKGSNEFNLRPNPLNDEALFLMVNI